MILFILNHKIDNKLVMYNKVTWLKSKLYFWVIYYIKIKCIYTVVVKIKYRYIV